MALTMKLEEVRTALEQVQRVVTAVLALEGQAKDAETRQAQAMKDSEAATRKLEEAAVRVSSAEKQAEKLTKHAHDQSTELIAQATAKAAAIMADAKSVQQKQEVRLTEHRRLYADLESKVLAARTELAELDTRLSKAREQVKSLLHA